MGKDQVSNARKSGTVIDWGVRFWLPNHYETRWSDGVNLFIRNVSVTISSENGEEWWVTGVDDEFVLVQSVIDGLEVGRRYSLELRFPDGDPYASSGAASPHSGRPNFDDLPPLGRWDVWDYQMRPARLGFELEMATDSDGEELGAKRFAAVFDDAYENDRPPPARGLLVYDNKNKVNHLAIDWRPDWLRRARSRNQAGDMEVAIAPKDEYSFVGGLPSHLVLHNIGGERGSPPAGIGSAINELTSAWIKSKDPWERDWKGIHYIVDYDGHVIKLAANNVATGHAGGSEWRGGGKSMNSLAIGIEHVHHIQDTEFPPEQRRACISLVRHIINHFGMDIRNVVGHGDVRTIRTENSRTARTERTKIGDYTLTNFGLAYELSWGRALHPHDRLVSCPGGQFPWDELAAEGLIPDVFRAPLPGSWAASSLAAHFLANGQALRRGDQVHGTNSIRLGGEEISPSTPALADRIAQVSGALQEAYVGLRTVGYSIPHGSHNHDDQSFEWPLMLAVKAFQLKFTTVRPDNREFGRITEDTAKAIVRATDLCRKLDNG